LDVLLAGWAAPLYSNVASKATAQIMAPIIIVLLFMKTPFLS